MKSILDDLDITLDNNMITGSGSTTDTITINSTIPNGTLVWGNSPHDYYYPVTGDTITTSTITNGTISNAHRSLNVKGDAEFEGDIIVKGTSLTDRLDGIEKRLGILRPNPKLEDKWEELKELGERYRQLEQEILEKEQIWSTLKK